MGSQVAVVEGTPHEPFTHLDSFGVSWWLVPTVVLGEYQERRSGRPKQLERAERRTWIGYRIGRV